MPTYKVVEVGSGGSGGGCLSTLAAFTIGLLFLSYACDSLTSQDSEGVAVSEQPPSPRSHSSSQSETSPPSEGEPPPEPEPASETDPESTPGSTTEPSASGEEQSEPSLRQQFINDWALRRVAEKGAPAALIAIAGARSFRRRIARELREQGVNAQSGVLKTDAYNSEEILRRLEGGDRLLLRRLGLAQLNGHLVLGRLSVREPDPGELYKADADLSIILVPLNDGHPIRKEFEARGGGFDQSDAREQALERVRRAFLTSPIADQLTRP